MDVAARLQLLLQDDDDDHEVIELNHSSSSSNMAPDQLGIVVEVEVVAPENNDDEAMQNEEVFERVANAFQ